MDIHKIGRQAAEHSSTERAIVQGRVLQYDADFACYLVVDLEESLNQNFHRLLSVIDMQRRKVGASHVNAHITLGTKSGREAMATVKIYQENRKHDVDESKQRVHELRDLLANSAPSDTMTPVFSLHHEADDIIVRMQHARIKTHGWESSVIMSGDKDLRMGQGYHADNKTGALEMVKGYGWTDYRDTGNVKPKLIGLGRSWFWYQMIMGDTADNIPGLEKISNESLDVYTPLKSGKARKAGSASCGEAKAVAVLEGVTNDKLASRRVWDLYVTYYGADAEERFVEQAYLLWMQRTDDPTDVVKYLRETCNLQIGFSEQQLIKVLTFKKLCEGSKV